MIFKVDGKRIEADIFVLAKDGIYIWDKNSKAWTMLISTIIARKDFFERSQKQLSEHPDYLDIDEIIESKISQDP